MREKLNIRLPTDEGPNPYDSKTTPEDLKPHWMKPGFILRVVILGLLMGTVAWWKTRT